MQIILALKKILVSFEGKGLDKQHDQLFALAQHFHISNQVSLINTGYVKTKISFKKFVIDNFRKWELLHLF